MNGSLPKAAIGVAAGAIMAAGAATVPVVPEPMQWVVSYETIAFTTPDGDLRADQYAFSGHVDRDGNPVYYVRETPKAAGQFTATTSPRAIVGKAEVGIAAEKSAENPDCDGCAYYTEFRNRVGETVRVPGERSAYRALRQVGAAAPARTERVPILSPNETEAAIAHDSSSNNPGGPASSASFSHTSAGSDRVLLLAFGGTEGSGSGCADCNVTAASYNGDALTTIRRDVATPFGDTAAEVMYLIAPDTGTNTVSVTFAGSVAEFNVGVTTLTGADQTSPIEANNSSSANSSSPSTSVTTVSDNAWVFDNAVHWQSGDMTAGAGQTQRWSTSSEGAYAASTEGPKTPAGSVTMSWSATASDEWVVQAVAVKPAAEVQEPATAAATTTTFKADATALFRSDATVTFE